MEISLQDQEMDKGLKDLCEKLISSIGNPTEEEIATYDKVVKLMKVGNYQDAMPMVEELCKKYPFNTIFLKTAAACHQELKDYHNAILLYNVSHLLFPADNLDCLFYCGVCHYKSSQFPEAKAMFEEFVASNFSDETVKKRAQLYLDKLNNINQDE